MNPMHGGTLAGRLKSVLMNRESPFRIGLSGTGANGLKLKRALTLIRTSKQEEIK